MRERTAHMIGAAASLEIDSGMGMACAIVATAYSWNVPSMMYPVGFMFRHSVHQESKSTPHDRFEMKKYARPSFPFRHGSQSRQQSPMYFIPTRSPTFSFVLVVCAPIATTCPTPSCPPTRSFFAGCTKEFFLIPLLFLSDQLDIYSSRNMDRTSHYGTLRCIPA